MPDAPTPAAVLPDDGATARRGLAGRGVAPRGVAAIALAVAVTAGVSGCGNDSTADASTSTIAPSDMSRIAAGNTPRSSAPDRSASLSSAASTTPATSRSASVASRAPGTASKVGAAALVIPDAAKAHTKDGAKAFVKFYWETLDQLDQVPEDGKLAALATNDCSSCRMQQQHVADLVKEGSHVVVLAPKKSAMAIRKDSTNDSVVVGHDYADDGCRHVRGEKTLRTYPATHTKVETRADWSDGGWRIGAIGHFATR